MTVVPQEQVLASDSKSGDDDVEIASDKSQYLTEGTTVCETVYERLKFDVSRPKCIVIGESWPSWLTVVLAHQFEPVCIYSGDFCNVKNYFPVKYRKA